MTPFPYQTTTAPPHHRRRSPSSPSSSATSFFAILLFLLILAITTTPTPATAAEATAQTPITPRRRAAFTHYNNQFFIQGGIIPSTTTTTPTTINTGTGELSILNLDAIWPTTTPAWTTLASGNSVWHHALVAVKPEHSAGLGSTSTMGHLLTVGGYPAPVNGFFSAFNLQTGVWTHLTTTPAPYVGLEGHTAVSHPTTGLVYVMGGFYNNNTGTGTGNNNTNMIRVANLLTVFDPKTAKVVNRIEATDANNMTGASAVWSSRRRTVLMFEGSRAVGTGDVSGIVQTAAVKEYDTASGQWKTFETKGSFPTRRLDACVVESDDGAKIIYFGGAVDANVFLNTIHILDVDSGQWTLGQPAPTGPRSQMACAYHSGFFVAFGGMTTTTSSKNQTEDVMYTSQPIVYDVNKNLWVDNFTPPDAADSGNLGDGSGSSSESSMDAVMWGGVGAIILMMLCALVGDYWNARRRKERKAIEMNARTRELLADSEDHHSSRRRTIHKRANSHSLHRVMTPAELYAAAAKAAAELQVAREAAIAAAAAAAAEGEGDDDGERLGRANSWNSETFSQSAPTASTSENDSTTRMNMMALARRTSNDTTTAPTSPTMATRDPQMYYLHLLNQQRILQAQAAQYPGLAIGSGVPMGAAIVDMGMSPTITTAGIYQQQQQQQDRPPRSPHSSPGGTVVGNNVGGGGDGSSSPKGSTDNKAISFSPPATPRRAPHTVVS
ncbi:MAG: hypothetical protein J3R72DRAFT_476095 [Linnemannia gamsii]|nr:MAG: hypothetical protein J3R72DRAFT_476095 [Linnemannia gamsii]